MDNLIAAISVGAVAGTLVILLLMLDNHARLAHANPFSSKPLPKMTGAGMMLLSALTVGALVTGIAFPIINRLL